MFNREELPTPGKMFIYSILTIWTLFVFFVESKKQSLAFYTLALFSSLIISISISYIVRILKKPSDVIIAGYIGDNFDEDFKKRKIENFKRYFNVISLSVVVMALSGWIIYVMSTMYVSSSGDDVQITNFEARPCAVDEIKFNWQTDVEVDSIISYGNQSKQTCNDPEYKLRHTWVLNNHHCKNNHFQTGTEGKPFPIDQIITVNIGGRSIKGKAVSKKIEVKTVKETCLCVDASPEIHTNHPKCETYSCSFGLNLSGTNDNKDYDLYLIRDKLNKEKVFLMAPNGMKLMANSKICDIESATADGMITQLSYFENNVFHTTERSTSIIVRDSGGRLYKMGIRSHTPSRMASENLGSMVGLRLDWTPANANGQFQY